MEGTLHPTPRMREVLVEQIRIVALGVRPVTVILGAIFGIITLLVAIDAIQGSADTWFETGEWAPIVLFSLLFPLAVWRADKRFGPAFLWTLPVDRRRLMLARVFAGWVWLFTAVAVLILWQLTLAALAGVRDPQTVPFIALPGATAAYLLASAVLLGLRHPLRWLVGAAALVFLLGGVSNELERTAGVDSLLGSRRLFSLFEESWLVWRTLSDPAQWVITSVVCVGTAAALLFAAVSRHRERRRR